MLICIYFAVYVSICICGKGNEMKTPENGTKQIAMHMYMTTCINILVNVLYKHTNAFITFF